MPTFGDYETVGEPVAITDEGGRVTTIWQARKNGASGDRFCAIKCFSPHPRTAQPGGDSADAPLETELRLEFIETVKHLKKARSDGGRNLAPVHEFGISDEGAWYAADYYKRSLKTWISLRGIVDDGALRHVVHSIAAGCLAMKRSCGRSHGNVKVGNIFLAGKPQAFRKTPLELIDARPASMVHAFRRGASDPTNAGQISELTEIHDLHAIGLIILQLVEGRIVRNEHDYNYPIQHSPDWNKLGKDAERWRTLCNQLLDPNLTLQDVSLESLAKKYRPSAVTAKLPLIIGGVAAVLVIAAGIYFLVPGADKKFQTHMVAAQDALDATNLLVARREIDLATKYKPQEPSGAELKTKIEQRLTEEFRRELTMAQLQLRARNWDEALAAAKRAGLLDPTSMEPGQMVHDIQQDQAYQTAIVATGDALKREDYPGAIQHANEALAARPDDVTAKNLLAQATDGRKLGDFENVLKKAQTAYEQRDYAAALTQANAALAMRPNDSKAISLKRDAEARIRESATQSENDQKYKQAIEAAQTAFAGHDYAGAIAQAENALAIRPNDSAAAKLRSDAQTHQRELATQAENDRRYSKAMALAQTAYERRDYRGAITQANDALAFRPHDAAAAKLINDAQARQRELDAQAGRDRNYREAMDAARSALNARNYEEAVTHADSALSVRPDDPDATQLKNDAIARQREAATQAENDRKYRQAIEAAQAAFASQDYATAITQADAALTIRSGDSTASRLKRDAQSRQRNLAIQTENDQKYKLAISAAQAAFAKQDYSAAISQADAALAIRPDDSTAATLKSEAQTRQQQIATQAETARKYKDAITAAQQASNQRDYATAIARADEALQIRPGDAEALRLKNLAGDAKDLQQAQADFQQSNYGAALQVCDAHKGTPNFDELAQRIVQEQKALADARNNASDTSYSLIDNLKTGSYSQKPPFVALFAQEETEKKNLADLQQLKAAGQWQAVRTKLGGLTPQGFLRPAAFNELSTWADGKAREIEDKLKALDSEFEVYLVRFNVLSQRQVFSPAARAERRIAEDMSEEAKDQYRKRVAYLETQYKQGGWLDKPGPWDKKKLRQDFLNLLKEHIDNHG